MKTIRLGWALAVGMGGLWLPAAARAQARGDWSLSGGNAGQTGWQKAEATLSPATVPKQFKFLWKIQLGAPAGAARGFTEPLLASRLISERGFKDFVYVGSVNTVYGVDSELGTLLWTKQYAMGKGCGGAGVSLGIEPAAAINFNARRAAGAPPPPPAPVEAVAPSARRLGAPAGGGGFGLKGIYALTGDGMLHEQVLTTGADFAPAVKLLPGVGRASGLNIAGKTVYTAASAIGGKACGGASGGVFALDMATGSYPVATYAAGTVLSVAGPVMGADGTAYVVTGVVTGVGAGVGAGRHAESVVALGRDMAVKDWFTPVGGFGSVDAVGAVFLTWKGRELIAAPGKDGAVALLDAAALGGPDHHTALAETPAVSPPGARHGWDSLATWQGGDGSVWVVAAISAPVAVPSLHGAAAHGAIVAYRVEDVGGKPALMPVWMSGDMVNPTPPRIANGVVIALAGGDAKSHARLEVLNATTGEELYSSGETIGSSTHLAGVAVGDGHVYFTDRGGVLYAFGIALEH